MRLRHPFCTLAATVLLGTACTSPTVEQGQEAQWTKEKNSYAERFQIWKKGNERRLLVFGHGGVKDTVGRYTISAQAPSARWVVLPARATRIATGSTTHVPYILALDGLQRVVACAHGQGVRNAAFQEALARGAITEIATGDGLDMELIIAAHPELLLAYPFGTDQQQVRRLGVPVVEVSEYLEEHPLGRAEWLRFFGTLLGQEQQADSIFGSVQERYEAERVQHPTGREPRVLFGSVWDGQWWVPPGNSYMARLIKDAGGRYVFADRQGAGNIAVDMETLISLADSIDCWGMIAQVEGEANERSFTNGDPRLKHIKAVKEGRLFLSNSAEEDIFGAALLEPDRVLLSLREVMAQNVTVDGPAGRRPKYFAGMYREPLVPRIQVGR